MTNTDPAPAADPLHPRPPAPFWWPEMKDFLVVAFVGLTLTVFWMIYTKPQLEKDTLFVTLATAIVASGLLGITGYFFGSTVSSRQKDATIAAAIPTPPPTPTNPSQ
jgi:hypothetical protein